MDEPVLGLKAVLAQIRPRHAPSLPAEPPALTALLNELERHYAAADPRPAPEAREQIHRRLQQAWQQDDLQKLEQATLRDSPYVLFSIQPVLAGLPRFLEAWQQAIDRQKPFFRRRVFRNYLHVVLKEYPLEDSNLRGSFPQWLALAHRLIHEPQIASFAKFRRWQQAAVFQEDFPQRLSERLLRERVIVWEELGFQHPKAEARQLLSYVCVKLKESLYQGLVTQSLSAEWLANVFRFMDWLHPETDLAPDNDLRRLASALLLPFVEDRGMIVHQTVIQSYLLRRLGDPRIQTRFWLRVDAKAQTQMRKWLVGQTLDDFFRLMDLYAQHPPDTTAADHWRRRSIFWKEYREQISDATLILGANAWHTLEDIVDDRKMLQHPKVRGSKQDQILLLMDLGQLRVLEGSHNTAVRFWSQKEKRAPEMLDRKYYWGDLNGTGCELERIYHGGLWETKVAAKLESYLR